MGVDDDQIEIRNVDGGGLGHVLKLDEDDLEMGERKLQVLLRSLSGTVEHLSIDAHTNVLGLRTHIEELGLGPLPTHKLTLDDEVLDNAVLLSELPSLELSLMETDPKGIKQIELTIGEVELVFNYIRISRHDGTSTVFGTYCPPSNKNRLLFSLQPHECLTEANWQMDELQLFVTAMSFCTSSGRSSAVYGNSRNTRWHTVRGSIGEHIIDFQLGGASDYYLPGFQIEKAVYGTM